jgi:hypothetical protein
MGEVVLKDMTLKIKVYNYKNKWDRVVLDQEDNVIWEEHGKFLTGFDSTTEGILTWVEQMRTVPHWKIVNAQVEIIYEGNPLEDIPDNLDELAPEELATVLQELQIQTGQTE